MGKMDTKAIRELSAIMDDRGVPHDIGRLISLTALPNTRDMVEWLIAYPDTTIDEMRAKAKELGEPNIV